MLPGAHLQVQYARVLKVVYHVLQQEELVKLAVLGLRAHAAQLLLVTAQAPGVVADLLRTQTTVAVQHLERDVRVAVELHLWTLCFLGALRGLYWQAGFLFLVLTAAARPVQAPT